MDLREFVKEALVQVASGVRDAQEPVRIQGGFVSPSVVSGASGRSESTHFGTLSSGQQVLLVEFDVAVTATDSVEGGAGAKLAVASLFSLEAGGKGRTGSETTSRIKFKVPLALPVDMESKKTFDAERKREDEMVRRHNEGQ